MKSTIKSWLAAIMSVAALTASAQSTNSGYFLDNYTFRHQMNPAMANDFNFVSFPGLSNVNVAMRGSLNLSSVLYNVDGRTCLFTNPNIPVDEVMKNIDDRNKIGANIKLTLLAGGFKAWGGYNTVSVNAVANVNASVPGAFFSLAKEGVANKTYDIKDMRANAMGYTELAFGHSRDIKQVPGLRVGANLKFLIGIANFDAYFNEARLTLGEDSWHAETNADIYANVGGFEYEHKYSEENQREYVSGANLDGDGSVGPNGFGMALDLGATYQWRDFTFSAAVLDLGFISFSKTRHASTNGTRTLDTSAYTFNANSDADNSFENEWDRLKTNLDDLYQLTDNGEIGSRSRALGATLNLGAEYPLPYYKQLKFGLLNSTRIYGQYSWTEFRFSANVNPVKCFSANANFAVGSYGCAFGWLLNFNTTGFNMFLGMDRTLGKVTKQFVPLSSNASVNVGINIPF